MKYATCLVVAVAVAFQTVPQPKEQTDVVERLFIFSKGGGQWYASDLRTLSVAELTRVDFELAHVITKWLRKPEFNRDVRYLGSLASKARMHTQYEIDLRRGKTMRTEGGRAQVYYKDKWRTLTWEGASQPVSK